jgi:hypothetical protein
VPSFDLSPDSHIQSFVNGKHVANVFQVFTHRRFIATYVARYLAELQKPIIRRTGSAVSDI